MALEKLLRLFNTVRYLRGEQIAYRLYYRFGRRLVLRRACIPVVAQRRAGLPPWTGMRFMPARDGSDSSFRFLGMIGRLDSRDDWNDPSKSKLWLYNLHYLDDLDAVDAETRHQRQVELLERWMRDNPPMSGNGWEPYPLSVRIVNLVKWFARQAASRPNWDASLARQTQALAVQIEFHILGNHLFANGKALVFAGAFLAGSAAEDWLQTGLRILDRAVAEQFLADGGHVELSPMYHAALLWDLCELINLAQWSGHPELQARTDGWRQVLARGLGWLAAMTHPDGDLAFFNDAAIGIAPRFAQLAEYAATLGVEAVPPAAPAGDAIVVRDLTASGYVALDLPQDGKLLVDVAQVGPDYQPGHAHADTLSLELSLFGQRVLVNSGTSCYGESAERHRQRGTASHSTLTVDSENSSEVWAGFRVARRARPQDLSIAGDAGAVSVSCAHDGYRRLPGKVTHRRTWHLTPFSLTVTDLLDGHFTEAVARFFLHPDVRPADCNLLVLAGGQTVRLQVEGGTARIVASTWHPQFGVSMSSHCIEVPFRDRKLAACFSWD